MNVPILLMAFLANAAFMLLRTRQLRSSVDGSWRAVAIDTALYQLAALTAFGSAAVDLTAGSHLGIAVGVCGAVVGALLASCRRG